MKIEIEWSTPNEAAITIAGRELKIEADQSSSHLTGLTSDELNNTFCGILARKLFGIISDAMQAEVLTDQFTDPWAALEEGVAQAVENRIF